jgi:hypothetical protein
MKKYMKNIIYICLLVTLAACNSHGHPSQNLLVNGSAEEPRYDSTPKGWQNVIGQWTSLAGDTASHSDRWSKEGKHFFLEGGDSLGILKQVISLNDYKSNVDAGKLELVFKGYVHVYPQDPPDQSRIMITCKVDTLSKALYTFDTDTLSPVDKWQLIADSFIAPASTRVVEVDLIAHRRDGWYNDGYFDDLSLVARNKESLLSANNMIIVGAIALLAIATLAFVYKTRRAKKIQHSRNLNTVKS